MRSRIFLLCIVPLTMILPIQGCHSPTQPVSPRANGSLSDVDFAKSTFAALADGDATVEQDIDWESFNASGKDIGAMYKAFSAEADRSAFRSAFVKSYSESFKNSGADVNSLKNWQLDKQDSETATVSAETVKHTHLRLTVSNKKGRKRLAGIDIGK